MKRILSSLLVVVLAWATFSCTTTPKSQDNFTAEVTIENMDNVLVYLEQYNNGKMEVVDSAELIEGKATFSGFLEFPEFYYITMKDQQGGSPFFADIGTNIVNISLLKQSQPTVTGSNAHALLDEFNQSIMAIDNKLSELYQQYRQAKTDDDQEKIKELDAQYEVLDAEKKSFMLNFAKKHTNSVVSAYIIKANSYMFELVELESVANVLDASIATSSDVEWLNKRIAILQSVAIGQPFVDFTQNDTAGNPVVLSEAVKGKYVLVDFWASWCSPCRAENPNVVAAYEKYHDKGFDVFGVSFDKSHDKWLQAIADDQLAWGHVSDLEGWGNAAGKLYGIQSIPQNILINPEGIIIERNLRGEDLQEYLAELFK